MKEERAEFVGGAERFEFAQQASGDKFLRFGRKLDCAVVLRQFRSQIGRKEFGFHAVTREHPGKFYIEKEIARRLVTPALDSAGVRYRIKSRIDLDVIEPFRVPAQARTGRKFGRIPIGDEPRIGPTCGADADACHEG